MTGIRPAAAALALAGAALLAGRASASPCDMLRGKVIAGAQIYQTEDVGGPITLAGLDDPSRLTRVDKPFCRVHALLRPTAGSEIRFEVWLPSTAAWNGKYAGVGNGGFIGGIMFWLMKRPFERGYAVSSTDSGHSSGMTDSSWARGRPERIVDWASRAHHLTAIASKQIVDAFYGTRPRLSYFLGCSKGGGTAMMEVQRFPDDYDGVIAGAPGRFQSGQVTAYLASEQAVLAPGGWLSTAKLALLHAAVLKACGGKPGYVEDPARCTFNPNRLLCRGADATTCLTAAEVATARRIYDGPRDGHGRPLYFGLARGSELQWAAQIMGPANNPGLGSRIYPSMRGYVGNLLLNSDDWQLNAQTPGEVFAQLRAKLGPVFDADSTDLTAFAARGGKFIQFQGWNDPIVAPAASTDYYERVTDAMGGAGKVRDFYRLFMAPGMNHCLGGDGPNAVGGAYNDPPPADDPEHDMLSALERWVEKGVPPEQIVATRYEADDPTKRVIAQRPWCAYPAVAAYVGSGDRNRATSYACRIPSPTPKTEATDAR